MATKASTSSKFTLSSV